MRVRRTLFRGAAALLHGNSVMPKLTRLWLVCASIGFAIVCLAAIALALSIDRLAAGV
jgi:hypothetical protein